MPADPGRYVPVNTSVLLQTLVEAVHEQVEERRAARALIVTPRALDADHVLVGDNDPALERALRVCGYLARVVEVDLFEPAREPAGWVAERVAAARGGAEDQDEAVASVCHDLARDEPIAKPSPDDARAMSWQIPGPGGHVRHHVARRAIEEMLRTQDKPVEGDPADLKRAWMYGFLVRTCEEALADAEPGSAGP